jgi:ribosomal protein L7Ae-like RNA K-turn-binding protein
VTTRAPRPFVVLGFASTHDALDAEALLEDMGVEVVPIPAPKSIGALCGIALRIEPDQHERALRYVERAGIEVVGTASIEDV